MKKRLLDVFYDYQPLYIFIIIGNIISSIYGYYFYWEQFLATPWYKWIFVPDCPLYDTLFILAFILIKHKKSNDFLNILVITNTVKYGLWTVLTIPLFSEMFLPAGVQTVIPLFGNLNLTFQLSSLNWLLVFLHAIMALESLLIYPFVKKWHLGNILINISWLFINDIFDYCLNTYPTAQLNYMIHDPRIHIVIAQNLIVNIFFLAIFLLKWRNQWVHGELKSG
ncbi:MAG: DUF1405 domain-containing protein [Candidatus Atribacteria bacterium]|nr:DUF1405 domain-containing protein [Candidatus Atribacteria bacterium]